MKRLAVESYRRKLVWLRAWRADPQVLAHFQQLTARWASALADPAALSRLFAVEARSHVLDMKTTCMVSPVPYSPCNALTG
jgi:hypothetical protein